MLYHHNNVSGTQKRQVNRYDRTTWGLALDGLFQRHKWPCFCESNQRQHKVPNNYIYMYTYIRYAAYTTLDNGIAINDKKHPFHVTLPVIDNVVQVANSNGMKQCCSLTPTSILSSSVDKWCHIILVASSFQDQCIISIMPYSAVICHL